MGHEWVNFIPVIWREPEVRAEVRHLAIWLPGFTGEKEPLAGHLEELAARGYVAVAYDLYQHGERRMEPQEAMVARVAGNRRTYFWEIIGRTAEDMQRVIDWAIAKFQINGTIVAGGISMGGDIALAAAAQDRRIDGVCSVIATPEWLRTGAAEEQGEPDTWSSQLYARLNPASHPAAYAARRVAIHFENAACDRFVPPDAARAFIATLRLMYGEDAGKLTLHEEAGLDHAFTEQMWQNSLQWFARQIQA